MPTGRLIRGMTDGCGDILLASAGTAGRRERVHATRDPDAARLWPSFNTVVLADDRVKIDAVAFSPKRNARPPIRRMLASVRRTGHKWELEPMTFRASDPAPRVQHDEARYQLWPSATHAGRWDLSCERAVELVPGARLRRYVDFVQSLPPPLARTRAGRRRSRRIELRLNGRVSYTVHEAVCRTLAEGAKNYGSGAAFEWVGLLCRYGAARATLRLERANVGGLEPFASVTDLATGRERPISLHADGEAWAVVAEGCAPRTLLRLYWPLSQA
jgi:hypothetical protein